MDGFQGSVLRGRRSLHPRKAQIDRPVPSEPDARRPTGYRAGALRGFIRGQRGSVAVEGAIAISILVAAFAGLMAIVQESYATDQMARAARAVARAVALDAQADRCAAIRRELGLADDFNCGSRWQVTVNLGVSPSSLSTLLAGTAGNGTASGDLILVRIGLKPTASGSAASSQSDLVPDAGNNVSGSGSAGTDPDDTRTAASSVPMVAMGVARSEPEAG